MELRLRETWSGALRKVVPPHGPPVTMYVCGPTVYDAPHVGHGRTYLVFDIARRHLEANGCLVRQVMNITDFEDRIFERANAAGVPWKTLARRAEERFLSDLASLDLLRPHRIPRASEHIGEMRDVGRRLEKTGRVRRESGGLLYRPPEGRRMSFPFPEDVHLRAVSEPAGTAPVPDEATLKEFAIWQAPRPGGPQWESPWGRGTPGWHVECYVMAHRYLGLPVSLHGGGQDLIFPHHYAENELSETLDGRPFARRYLHPAFVLQEGQKMAKSRGNLVTLREAVERHGASVLRWYLLSRPYSEALEWDPDGLEESAARCEFVRTAFRDARKAGRGGPDLLRILRATVREVDRCIATDLDTPGALRALEQGARSCRPAGPPGLGVAERGEVTRLLRGLDGRLGLRILDAPVAGSHA